MLAAGSVLTAQHLGLAEVNKTLGKEDRDPPVPLIAPRDLVQNSLYWLFSICDLHNLTLLCGY